MENVNIRPDGTEATATAFTETTGIRATNGRNANGVIVSGNAMPTTATIATIIITMMMRTRVTKSYLRRLGVFGGTGTVSDKPAEAGVPAGPGGPSGPGSPGKTRQRIVEAVSIIAPAPGGTGYGWHTPLPWPGKRLSLLNASALLAAAKEPSLRVA